MNRRQLASLDAVDPIRTEMMAGRGLIALGIDNLESMVRDAARVLGATDRLRVLRLDRPLRPQQTLDAQSRRLAPIDDPAFDACGRMSGLMLRIQHRGPTPAMKAAALASDPPPGIAHLASIDWDEVLDGRHAIVVTSGDALLGDAVCEWMHGIASRRALRRGEEPILFLSERNRGRMPIPWARASASLEHRPLYPDDAIAHVSGTPAAIKRAFSRAGEDNSAWREAVARFVNGANATREWDRVVLSSSDRLVVAVAHVPLSRDPHARERAGRGVDVFEIAGDGYCHGINLRVPSVSFETLDAVAELAWRGGPAYVQACASRLEQETGERARTNTWHASLLALREPNAGFQAVRAAMGDRIDMDLSRALSGAHTAQAVLRCVAGDPSPLGRRRDFALTWPAFADHILASEVRDGVDAGIRTLPLMARRIGVTVPVARRLVGRFRMPIAETRELAGYLAAIGHDGLPPAGDRAEWNAFMECSFVATRTLRSERVMPDAIRRLVTGLPGRGWAARQAALEAVGAAREARYVNDMVQALAAWLAAVGVPGVTPETAFGLLSRHGSLLRLLDASRTWHDTPELAAGLGMVDDGATWPVPFRSVDLGDGWSAHALGSVAELRAEGRGAIDASGMAGLDHCVGGYGPRCMAGDSKILSLRRVVEGRMARVSTCELRRYDGGTWLLGGVAHRLAQHRGIRNAVPAPDANAYLERLRWLLERGMVPAGEMAARLPNEPVVEPLTPESLHGHWRRVLPPKLAALSLADLVAEASSPG